VFVTSIAPFTFSTFPLVTAGTAADQKHFDGQAALAYVNGEWPVRPDLKLEAGLFLRYFDDDAGTHSTQPDPRIGIAWRVTPEHWLRATAQRDLVLPIRGTLAPVAAVGLTARNELVAGGGSVTTYQLRWDAEWSPRVFTFLGAEEQRLHRFFMPVPLSLGSMAVDTARSRSVLSGVNVWLGDRWGVFARHRWSDSETLTKDGHGRDLPLVPRHTVESGLTWVHPWQIRATVFGAYVGERASDLTGTRDLHDYWTANLSGSWHPFQKLWAFTLAVQNLFDARVEVARGSPAPGRTVSALAEYRFDAK
jgi:outer membrane receptor protein involved in Fe transport